MPEPWLRAQPIETPRLRLDPLIARDADALHPVLDDQRLHEFVGGEPLTLEELQFRFEVRQRGLSPDGQEVWLSWIVRLREGGAPIGFVQAGVEDLLADAAWVIGTAWQGNGYAAEAASAMVDWLFANRVQAVIAAVHPDHAASQGVARRCGLILTEHVVNGEQIWRRDV